MKKEKPALLSLFEGRRAWERLPHREPTLTPSHWAEFAQRAEEYAKANPSDPFAKQRKLLYLKRGLED